MTNESISRLKTRTLILAAALLSSVATSQLHATQVEWSSFDSDGVTIRYQVEGAGEPVLLIHGYRADGNMNWRFAGVNKRLADKYKVITIDNRGHGKSDKPEDPAAYGKNMVLDQIRLLDHLGIESAHVAGYSMGGMIALRMLVDYPERVRSAAICGMGWRQPSEPRRQSSDERTESRLSSLHQAIAARWDELNITKEQLEAILVPMITIIGEDDGLYESTVVPMRELRPDIPLELIEGAAHAGAPMKLRFREALREWIDQQR